MRARLLFAVLILVTSTARAKPLVVGTRIFPPFVMKQADGSYTGISMELWKRVAQKLQLDYVVKEATAPELLEPETHGVDVVVSLPITAINGRNMDLTHAFYSTGLAIATRVESTNALVTSLPVAFLHVAGKGRSAEATAARGTVPQRTE